MVGSLRPPNAPGLGVSVGPQQPSCQGPQPPQTRGFLAVGRGGDAGGADPAAAALTAEG